MITFNREKKEEVLSIAKDHRKADRFIQGEWLGEISENGMFRGCFFGCMTQSRDNTLSIAVDVLNIPYWVVYVSEKIFEGLPSDEAVEFPVKLIESLKCDEDLTEKFKLWQYTILMDSKKGQINYTKKGSRQYDVIKQCADLFVTDYTEKLAWSAESAAWSAAAAAWSASETVAESAARSAARSAAAAAWLARSSFESSAMSAAAAAWSASETVAESAASSAEIYHYKWMRDALINILKK